MSRNICWIDIVAPSDAEQELVELFASTGVEGQPVENLYQAFGLRPHFLQPAHDLYLAGLHNEANRLPAWILELVASYVAILTQCVYAVAHHGENFLCAHPDRATAETILAAMKAGSIRSDLMEPHLPAILAYTRRLTQAPDSLAESDVEALRSAGLSDGEILEVNQVCAMFNYWSRVINGLGIQLGDEPVGDSGSRGKR